MAFFLLDPVGQKVKAWKEGGRSHPALSSRFASSQPSMPRLFTWIAGMNPALPAGAPIEPSLAPQGFPARSLFVTGEEDEVVPTNVVKSATDSVEGASYVLIPASGHSPYFEQAGAFNRIVAEFLAG